MVIMSMDINESITKQMNILRELEISENQIKEGKVKDAKNSLASLRERYEFING